MAFDLDDENKKVQEFSERIPFGVTKVQLVGVTAGETEAGKDFIEFTVTDKDGVEDTARIWFVGGAANISFNTARQIIIHQGKDEEEKAKLGDRVDAVKNSDDLADILNEFAGGELWFTKYYDPKRTYETENGVFRSVNKNVLGYEPKLKPELMPKPKGEDVTETPFGPAKDAGSTVPGDDSWAK